MLLIGVDEAGRGPLAGPVSAAAVCLDASQPIEGLADSKRLSAIRRERLAPIIRTKSLAYGIAFSSVEEIDEMNILRATFLAMSRAVEVCLDQLRQRYETLTIETLLVQVDGSHRPCDFDGPWNWPYRTEAIVKGDQTVAEISAASILAKTSRDEEMRVLDQRYPGYQFSQHAGYGTALHLAQLQTLGVSPVHRRTFAPVRELLHRGLCSDQRNSTIESSR